MRAWLISWAYTVVEHTYDKLDSSIGKTGWSAAWFFFWNLRVVDRVGRVCLTFAYIFCVTRGSERGERGGRGEEGGEGEGEV